MNSTCRPLKCNCLLVISVALPPKNRPRLYAYLAPEEEQEEGGREERRKKKPQKAGRASVQTVFNRWLKCMGRARTALESNCAARR